MRRPLLPRRLLPVLGRRGAVALEFGLLGPVVGLILLASFDFAQAVQTSMRLERCAQVGALYATVQPRDLAGIRAAVRAAWPGLTEAEVPMPTERCTCAGIAVACDSVCAGTLVWTVTVTAQRSITPIILQTLRSRSGSATVRVQ